MPRCALSTSLRRISTAAGIACALLSAPALAYESPFVTAVVRTSPLMYVRLEASSGMSSGHSFTSRGPVRIESPGIDPASESNRYARLNGQGTFFETNWRGGVGRAGSIMAWVNLDMMPRDAGRILYVAGISQNGNDFDLQFEPDNTLRFYTAAGSNLRYAPVTAKLVGQWHMVVATFDIDQGVRNLYWDGSLVATDHDAGKPGKMGQFNIGGSTVWAGRFFIGGLDEVALWNKALTEDQVSNFYSAATSGATAPPSASAPAPAAPPPSSSAAITTTAKVEVEDANGKIPLKPEEQIAMMFLSAIQSIQSDCQLHAGGACTIEQMVAGPKAADNWHISKLKYDPAMDPNYAYTVKVNGKAWEARADPKKPGLGGFYFFAKMMSPDAYYNATGPAGPMDRQLTSRGIMGDSFSVR